MTKVDTDFLNEYKLAENEYFVKKRYQIGFMTKKNKDGSIPKAFENWGEDEVYLLLEEFRNGWRVVGERNGQSASWIKLKHPEGFTIEIKGSHFIGILSEITIENGLILNKCYFEAKTKRISVESLSN